MGQYLGEFHDRPTQPTGRSLDRLGNENTRSETGSFEESRGNELESAVLESRHRPLARESPGSGQSAQYKLRRQDVNDTESRVAGEEQPQLRQSEQPLKPRAIAAQQARRMNLVLTLSPQ